MEAREGAWPSGAERKILSESREVIVFYFLFYG
jgi:hypothetical protein